MKGGGVTFQVSSKVAEKLNNASQSLSERFSREQSYLQEAAGEFISGSNGSPAFKVNFSNGFVGSCVSAYNRHHNLVIRPDDVWTAIMVQFSFYIQKRAEELRSHFVDFDGQKELVVYGGGTLRTASYDMLAIDMTKQIAEHIKDPSVREWVMPQFSTTTNTDTTVYAVVLMATMQTYFRYKFELCCGIPHVTLLGTVADWESLASRIDRLLEFGELMCTWHALLKPILLEFVQSANGKPNIDFWDRICHKKGGGSGPRYLGGWITAFCRFSEKGDWQGGDVINDNDVPVGYVSVPVTVDDNGQIYKTRMFAGSLAAERVDDYTLAPRSDWCIALIDEEKIKTSKSKIFF